MNPKAISISIPQWIAVSLGLALMYISAKIQIPMWPLPVTLQTLAVMVLGLCFPAKAARGSILTYVGLGVMGLPVLAGPFVFVRLGYLVGFILAVEVMIRLRDHLKPIWVCLAGSTCVYVLGVIWLSIYFGPYQAVMVGFLPFVLPGIIKTGLLVGIMRFFRGPNAPIR